MSGLISALLQNQQFQQGATVDALSKIAALQEKRRADELTRKFLSMGDYSPERIQKFAQATGATQDDMIKLMGIAKEATAYKKTYDPMTEYSEVDPNTGIATTKRAPESQLPGSRTTAVPAQADYVGPDGSIVRASQYGDAPKGATLASLYANDQQMKYNMGRDKVEDQHFNTQQSNAKSMFNTKEANDEKRSLREYGYKTQVAKQEATEKAAKEESAKIDSILKEGKAMLVPKGPPIFSLDGSVDEAAATAVYDEIKPLVNSPDRGKAAAAQQWMNAFNRKFGVTTNQVAVEDPLGLFK